MNIYTALIAACLVSSLSVEAANILAAFPAPGRSHWIALRALLKELAKRGHNVTAITPFRDSDVPDNWVTILVPDDWSAPNGTAMGNIFEDTFSPLHGFNAQKHPMERGLKSCEMLFQQANIQELINMKEQKFDILIMEYFAHNCFLAFAHKFRIPVIGMSAMAGYVWTTDMVGNPTPFSYIPDIMLDYTDHMSFFERLINTLVGMYGRLLYQYYYVPEADAIVKKYFKEPDMPSIADIGYNTSLLIVMTHPSFSYPRPLLPNVIEAGGMHIEAPHKLPQDLQKYLDEATDGVIYFSMGSNLKSTYFSEEKRSTFLEVFSKLKQRILWKWEGESIPGLPSNVKLQKWVPQSDVLAHKNVRAFITQGGQQSMAEAVSSGVPLIAIPAVADQRLNAQRAAAAGYCIKLDTHNITHHSLHWALSEILYNDWYAKNAKMRSKLFHDRPQKPLDTAVYWTEYVLTHNGAHHLRSAALDLHWYQYLLLDVAAAILVGVTFLLLGAWLLIRTMFRWCFRATELVKSQKKLKRRKKD